jgi:hypothetical protein
MTSEVLMAVNINNMTFLDMTVYSSIDIVLTVSRNTLIPSYSEDGSSSFLQNLATYLSKYGASYSKTTTILISKIKYQFS